MYPITLKVIVLLSRPGEAVKKENSQKMAVMFTYRKYDDEQAPQGNSIVHGPVGRMQ